MKKLHHGGFDGRMNMLPEKQLPISELVARSMTYDSIA